MVDGTQVSVAVTSIANSYLSLGGQASLGGVANPLADLRALTVADYTFLVNKNRPVRKAESEDQKSGVPKDRALIVVKLGDYEKAYSIYIDDKLVPLTATLQGSSNTDYHDYSNTGHLNPRLQPATYISGPATASAGPGSYADTEYIARDLESCLASGVVNTSSGVSSIVINSGPSSIGNGWLGGRSSGVFERSRFTGQYVMGEEYRKELKLEVFITQSGSSTASAELIVTKGVITGVKNIKKGSGFNPSNPITLSYKVSIRNWKFYWFKNGDRWEGWEEITNQQDPHYYIPPATFNSSTNVSTDPVQITTQSFTNGGFQVERNGSVIMLTSSEGPFKIRVEDGLGNQGLSVITREVDNITDLPASCYNSFGPVKVIGDADINQDDYYVRFSTKDKSEFGEGSWVETVGYYQEGTETSTLKGIDVLLAAGTMPITLVPFFNNNTITDFKLQAPGELLYARNGSIYYRLDKEHLADSNNEPGVGVDWEEYWTVVDENVDTNATVGYLLWRSGTFYYGPTGTSRSVGWAGRGAGDDNTNPFPSFVGKQIRDIFFFKNRLGILTDSNVIFSEADEYFNFFRTTTQQLLDSAPIDVGLSHTKVAILEHAVPFQEKLMLFSQGSQFVLRGADVLSPKTVAISPVTEYDLSDGIQPVALGNYIYFPFKRNDFEGVYEYFVDNNTETFNAEEITEQIPKYITSDVQKIVGSQAENTIVMSTTADAKTLFVYKYFWSNKEKIQSAWMKFTFNRDVRGFDFIDSNLHLITADTDGLHLEKLTLEDGLTDEGLDYTLYLDSKVDGSELTTSYDVASKTTTISGFEYDPTDVVVYTKAGNKVIFTRTSSTAGTVSGDITSTDFVAGIPYNMLYRFSDQSLKQPTERGGRSASDYTFQTIRNGSINYADTGHFTVEVTPKYRDKYSYAFNPDSLGANLTLNAFTPQNGHFRFPIQCQPNDAKIEVVTDSALPVKLLAAEFESMVISRSRRYGA
jgi:hypothetical protein